MNQEKERLAKLVGYYEKPSVIRQIDSAAERAHLNRATFCRIAVRKAIEEAKT